MQNQADGEYRFIGHIVDHFSKFRIIFPMKTKSAAEVAKNCINKFFSVFGLPQIIHTDNGSEFVNDVIRAVVVLWPGKCHLIQGSVGHSQSQGMVEQGNNTIRLMTAARMEQDKVCKWSEWLSEFQCMFYVLISDFH